MMSPHDKYEPVYVMLQKRLEQLLRHQNCLHQHGDCNRKATVSLMTSKNHKYSSQTHEANINQNTCTYARWV
jgi:hypothetical protein